MEDYRFKALQSLTRARFHAVQNLTREKQRFMNYLFLKCSGLAQEKVFSDSFGATALAVYEEFEYPDDIANMDVDELTAFISEKGKNRSPRPGEIAKAAQTAARGSYRLPKTINDSVNQILSISISSMRAMKAQIKALDKEIERQVDNIPNTLNSVPGIGPVISAGILAEIGDIHRFNGQASLAKYAGLAWKEHKSGMFEGQNTRVIKSGNRFLKILLVRSCQCSRALRHRVPALLRPQIPRGQQVSAQTRTRFNCQKTGPVGLSTAERQPPVYLGVVSCAALIALFLKLLGQGFYGRFSFCAFLPVCAVFLALFLLFRGLTFYRRTRFYRKPAFHGFGYMLSDSQGGV
jgi:hypothetical protein